MITSFNNQLSEVELNKLLDTWRTNREEYNKYNGWVILPKKNRDRLWYYTEGFINPVFDSIDNISEPKKIFLIYELNWRLEKTLTPLVTNEWIDKITTVVNTFNPYPNLIDFEGAIFTPNKDEYQQKDWNWENIQEAWVNLAFALLRSARDNHEKESFDLWLHRLENIVAKNTEWQSRWYYEKCLFHLYRLEQDRLFTVVQEWELTTIPDFWQIKRASILAQIGRLREAQKTAQQALNKIRSCIQPDIINYNLLSQEGWGMLLLQEIEEKIKWDTRKWDGEPNRIYLDRWEKLEQYRCNPNTEIDFLEQAVARETPKAQQKKERKRAFLPGRTTRTLRFGTKALYPEYRPAFESLRIYEESGIPLSLINIQWHCKHISNATKWSISFFPTWSFLALIQVSKSDSVKEWLSFVDIAILPQEEIDYIYDILYGFLSKVVYQLTNLRINSSYTNEYLDSKLAIITETISYLCIRLDGDRLNNLFDLAIKIYKIEAFRQGFCLQDCPGRLFKMLFYSLPQSEIINRLKILLKLPIGGQNGFEVSIDSHFTEPFEFLAKIDWSEEFKIRERNEYFLQSDFIRQLIDILQNGNDEARRRASLRLGTLNDLKILSSEEQNLFAQALWNNYDPNNSSNNLPKNTGYHDFGFLFLPEPQPGIAKSILSQYIIGHFELIDSLDTRSNISLNKLDTYCTDLKNSTSPLYRDTKVFNNYINWSSENAEYFLIKINSWWSKQKEGITRLYRQEDSLLHNDLASSIQSILSCLSEVILPRLKNSSDDIKQSATTFISELEEINISVISILPMTLFIESDDVVNNIAKKLRLGLSSLNSEEVDNATIGLEDWLICSQQSQIPEPPPELLNDLVNKVFHRGLPRLNFAIYILGQIINKCPSILNESQLETLLFSLEFLLPETKLPENWQYWKLFNEDITTIIEIEDRPEYMRLTAYLALQLYQIFENKEREIPEILIQWKEACLNSIFPEVRRVWEGVDK